VESSLALERVVKLNLCGECRSARSLERQRDRAELLRVRVVCRLQLRLVARLAQLE